MDLYASGCQVLFCLWMPIDFCMPVVSECCFVAGSPWTFVCKWLQSVVLSLVAHGFLYASAFRVLFCLRLLIDFCMQVASTCCFVSGCSWIFVCKWFFRLVSSLGAQGFLDASGFRVSLPPCLPPLLVHSPSHLLQSGLHHIVAIGCSMQSMGSEQSWHMCSTVTACIEQRILTV